MTRWQRFLCWVGVHGPTYLNAWLGGSDERCNWCHGVVRS